MSKNNYATNVFINCPFDERYKKLQQAVIFTIFDCGFYPRCALEENNSGAVRFTKIKKIIAESQFGIHDLSRTEVDKKSKLPRFNMPLELGVFLGASELGDKKQKKKKCLILDKIKYRYQRFISDLAGHDIETHSNNEKILIRCIRDWLSYQSKKKNIPGASEIIKRFNRFKKDLPLMCKQAPIKIKELTYNDYAQLISQWLKEQ
jgi:hypothetical protein